MAKLTDRQRANILAKWHTGEYTKTELAKQYKISITMIGKIVGKEEPNNSHIVEAGVLFENAKKFNKSLTEISAIDNAIKSRYERSQRTEEFIKKVDDLQFDLLEGIKTLLNKGTISKPIKLKNGDFDVVEHIEHDLTPQDLHTMIKAVDDAAQTVGVSAKVKESININNANNQQTIIDKDIQVIWK